MISQHFRILIISTATRRMQVKMSPLMFSSENVVPEAMWVSHSWNKMQIIQIFIILQNASKLTLNRSIMMRRPGSPERAPSHTPVSDIRTCNTDEKYGQGDVWMSRQLGLAHCPHGTRRHRHRQEIILQSYVPRPNEFSGCLISVLSVRKLIVKLPLKDGLD